MCDVACKRVGRKPLEWFLDHEKSPFRPSMKPINFIPSECYRGIEVSGDYYSGGRRRHGRSKIERDTSAQGLDFARWNAWQMGAANPTPFPTEERIEAQRELMAQNDVTVLELLAA